jgi:hypothetical protein
LSFIFRQRLFGKPVRLDYYPAFIFEVILALNLWAIVGSLGDLAGFASGRPIVVTSPWVFTLFGGLGLYGVRMAMYIAVIRRNRAPQPAEWLVTLLGLGLACFFLLFGGSMLNWFADLHGYDRCPVVSSRADDAVFVLHGKSCPAGNALRIPEALIGEIAKPAGDPILPQRDPFAAGISDAYNERPKNLYRLAFTSYAGLAVAGSPVSMCAASWAASHCAVGRMRGSG